MFEKQKTDLRMVAWEVTRSCNLACSHCRASSKHGSYPNELTTDECFRLIDEITSFSRPVIILTGGEPLLRKDIFDIAGYGRSKGLTLVMAPNGTLLNDENIKKIMLSGIKRISVSLDGPDAASHDNLRQVPGAFQQAIEGIERSKNAGLEFQINSTITKRNINLLLQITKLAQESGAEAHHIFLLVPTGRAREMANEELSAAEYEEALKLLAKEKKNSSVEIKITCAPHFNRILLQEYPDNAATLYIRGQKTAPLVRTNDGRSVFRSEKPQVSVRGASSGRGCMAGSSFCFISHIGGLQPCGYLEIECGNIRELGFKKAWFESEVFNALRDFSGYKGKCGVCEFKRICGGCRARAYAKYADYLREEPYCIYEPAAKINKVNCA